MKHVRLKDNVVVEIIPDAATIPSIEHWYGAGFAAQCVEGPDEVQQGWVYSYGIFSELITPTEDLQVKYEARTVELIRAQYSADDEYKILREYLAYADTNTESVTAFNTYNSFVEDCKLQAHSEVYGGAS